MNYLILEFDRTRLFETHIFVHLYGTTSKANSLFFLVCYTAIEEIGFEKFDIQSNYEDFLARLCVDLTQFSDSTGGSSFDRHRVSIKLKDLKSKAFYEECSIEYLGDAGRYVKDVIDL